MGFEVRTDPLASGKAIEKQPRKKAYPKPTFKRYGQAKDLTTAGPGLDREVSPIKKPPDR
jgi:hypothetical protein